MAYFFGCVEIFLDRLGIPPKALTIQQYRVHSGVQQREFWATICHGPGADLKGHAAHGRRKSGRLHTSFD
jgi:hypothetical protein